VAHVKRPLSLAQRAILEADQLRPGILSEKTTISIALRVDGSLDLERLAHAYDALVSRHDILRSQLVASGHVEVHAHRAVLPEVLSMDPEAFFAHLDAVTIDPHRPPVVRCFVVPRHQLVGLVFSHAVIDPSGARVAIRDLAALYDAEGELPMPPQYHDYALWEAEHLDLERHRAAWERILAGVKPARYARQVPFVVGRKAAPVIRTLPLLSKAETKAIASWSWRHRSTLSITLLAAFARGIREDADRDDLVVSTAFERRDSPDARHMIGNFLKGTPLRLRVDEREPVRELVERTRAVVLEAYEHANVPLSDFVELMPRFLPGALGLTPTWVRFFQFVPTERTLLRLGEASATIAHLGGGGDPQDLLGLHLGAFLAEDGSLHGRLNYDTHELDEENALRTVDEFRHHALEVLR
jgi:hypothetical protein